MFAKATQVSFAQRVVATLVASAMFLFSIGAYNVAQAANLTDISDTLSTSNPTVTSAHTIQFNIPNDGSDIATGENITITFPTAAGEFVDVDTTVDTDLTVTIGGSGATVAGFTSTDGGNFSTIQFNSSDVAGAAGDTVIVAIADGKIINPTTSNVSYEIEVAIADGNTGKTRVAIVDTVEVTAIVETVFDFTITGTATGTPANGTSTTGSTSPTQIPFGVLTAGEIKTMSQVLNVTTNAANGYVVTVEQDGNLQSSTGADIDGFRDGAYTDTPEAWGASPINTLLDEDTWGHWGLTSSDGDLQGAGIDFGSDEWVAASTTPRAVMAHNDPADGVAGTLTAVGDDVGSTTVAYQIEITPLQEAADDYNTTLTYIATPTF